MSPAARSAIGLTAEPAAVRSPDLVLHWEVEAGTTPPFRILHRFVPSGADIQAAIPLDLLADTYVEGVTATTLVLPGEASADRPPGTYLYQVADASGACSNLGHVVVRPELAAQEAWEQPRALLAVPTRSVYHDASDLLDSFPALRRVQINLWADCTTAFLERQLDGSYRGEDFFIPPHQGVWCSLATSSKLAIVGAASPDDVAIPLRGWPAGHCAPVNEDLALPVAIKWRHSDELLCGIEGVDWVDADVDGEPDQCTQGLFSRAARGVWVIRGIHGSFAFTTARTAQLAGLRSILFAGRRFPLEPGAATAVEWVQEGAPARLLRTHDAGTSEQCTCFDTDGDVRDDCTELLEGTDPNDPSSVGPDSDGDGVRDDRDVCPTTFDPVQRDGDLDGRGDACDPCPADPLDRCVDPDGDGVPVGRDNCDEVPNPEQTNSDGDVRGDACDDCPLIPDANEDADGDTLSDACRDNCVLVPNPDQDDRDEDGRGDACDVCPFDPLNDDDLDGLCAAEDNCPLHRNADQLDTDGDRAGDACDPCPVAPRDDADMDRVCDDADNCPGLRNPDQADADGDGFGDPCDDCPLGEYPLPELQDLRVRFAVPGARFARELTWTDLAPADDVTYDVFYGSIDDLSRDRGFASFACLASDLTTPWLVEVFHPGSLWYLATSRSPGDCHRGTVGRSASPDGSNPRGLLDLPGAHERCP
jgi:hypothetical protein